MNLLDGLRRMRDRWRPWDVYLAAVAIFAASRLVVVMGTVFGTLLELPPGSGKWDLGEAWYLRLLRWDSGWYAKIVTEGYRTSIDPTIQSSTVFYPLYPLVSRVVASVLGVSHWVALLLVANVAALVAVLLMTKLTKDELGDEIALWSLALFCFFPWSLVLSAGYTEPLFLAFVLASLILLMQEKFLLAAVMAGLSLGTRSTGIVMIPVILWEMARRSTLPWPQLLPRLAVCAVVAASGLLFFMAYLGIAFGHPFAFATGQAGWHKGTLVDRVIGAVTLAPFLNVDWRVGGPFLFFLAIVIWSFRRLPFAVSLYGLGALLLPYLTLGITGSMNRFILACFPAFMALGILVKGRPWLAAGFIGVSAALLLAVTALFSQWYPIG
jgi:hypothetical protein